MNRLNRLVAVLGLTHGIATAAPSAQMETFLDAPGPQGALKGSLLAPAAPSGPVVLIIPGSGPTDRDGNNPLGVRAATYRLLAEGLAARGITTVRIDKRGMFASRAALPDANAVTIDDYAKDIDAWIRVVREHTGTSCVWLLGHSEGGLVAMVAANARKDVCGLLLAAAPGRRMGDILREQLSDNPANAPLRDQAFVAIDRLEKGQPVDTTTMHPALLGLFGPQVQGFLMSAFSYEPARLLEHYPKPVLILQGQKDLQIREIDALTLNKANPAAALVQLRDVNHVLKHVAHDSVDANLATYADPALPLAPGVIDAIGGFIEKHHQTDGSR
ncbi:alpha/beta fold hydrolase [Paludibacterium paludis]|uniref:Alpha/beta hydrolase n=1 Tax=Paludibacterium paludis TaxID=1225769 RepID=A0A918P749_9NEIS|nr:alpha/beta fold hydrolase [Paludibacterium paludis]GGY29966.1 alpha/beta hydrolase [Paludibacterium paludis]